MAATWSMVVSGWLVVAAGVAPASSAVLAVSDTAGPSAELVDLTRQVRAALATMTRTVISEEETRLRLDGAPRDDVLARAEVASQAALRDLVQGRYAAAAEGYSAIVTEFDRYGSLDGAHQHWARALLQEALCQHRLGQKELSTRSIERLLRSDPDAAPDSAIHPKAFREHFAAVRADFLARPRHMLAVNASNPRARIFVELREMGVGSARLRVASGRYRVAVAVGGLNSSPVTVGVVDRDETLAIDTAPLEALRPEAGPGLAVAPTRQLDAVGMAAGRLSVDRLYLVSLEGAGASRALVVEVHDARAGKSLDGARLPTASGSWPPGGVAELAGLLVDGTPSPQSPGLVERWDRARALARTQAASVPATTSAEGARKRVISPEARALLAGPRPGAELQRGKEVISIDLVPGGMGAVLFKHADHIQNRLHPEGRPLRCKDCHHDLPTDAPEEAAEVERCVACHLPLGPRVQQPPGVKKVARPMAYVKPDGSPDFRTVLLHSYCRDCHRQSKDGGKMLEACRACHEHGVTSEMIR